MELTNLKARTDYVLGAVAASAEVGALRVAVVALCCLVSEGK